MRGQQVDEVLQQFFCGVVSGGLQKLHPLSARYNWDQCKRRDLDSHGASYDKFRQRQPILGLHARIHGANAATEKSAVARLENRGRRSHLFPLEAHLNKIQPGVDVVLHNEHRQMAVGLLDAVVQHPNEDVRIVLELYHELLVFLHHLTAIKVSGRYLCGSRPDTVVQYNSV